MSWIDSAFSSPYTDFALSRNITAGLVATTVACRHHSLIQNCGEFVTMRAPPPNSTLFQPAQGTWFLNLNLRLQESSWSSQPFV
jgi:hypothetical protein